MTKSATSQLMGTVWASDLVMKKALCLQLLMRNHWLAQNLQTLCLNSQKLRMTGPIESWWMMKVPVVVRVRYRSTLILIQRKALAIFSNLNWSIRLGQGKIFNIPITRKYCYRLFLCKVVFSLSNNNQPISMRSTLDWVLDSQSEFDWVAYKHHREFPIE